MTARLDPRRHPVRPDAAARYLADSVDAPRYLEARPAQVAASQLSVRRRPEATAPLDTQLLMGESLMVYEISGDWAWLQNDRDGYVGYALKEGLASQVVAPSHWVGVLRTFIYPAPDLKAPPIGHADMTARLRVEDSHGRFSRLSGGGYVYSAHVLPLSTVRSDYVQSALAFLGAPYLWGGKGSLGLDCSALVQLAMHAAGLECPRDTDMQEAEMGQLIAPDLATRAPERGDVIFFPGHVAIALDARRVVHANAKDMLVAVESLEELVARVKAESDGTGATAVRRPARTTAVDRSPAGAAPL